MINWFTESNSQFEDKTQQFYATLCGARHHRNCAVIAGDFARVRVPVKLSEILVTKT